MKQIIVPVDFSPASKNAYAYACQLAGVFNASLKLIHVYSGSFSGNEPLATNPNQSVDQMVLQDLQQLGEQQSSGEGGSIMTKVKKDYAVLKGFTVAEIVKEAKASEAFMIVMGTTGRHDVLEKAIGTVSTGVAQRASCPVFLVPEKVSYHSFDNIMYTCNYRSVTDKLILQHIDFANIFRAAMHFVHVSEGTEEEYEAIEDTIFDLLFKDGDPAFAFNLVTLKTSSVVAGLQQYALENEVDLMVVVNYREGFIDNVLGKSVTKELGLYTRIPLLVMPMP